MDHAVFLVAARSGLYSEKKVIVEERRLRVENSPGGLFQQQFSAAALSNNYRRSVIGSPEDFEALGRREVEAFFQRCARPAGLLAAWRRKCNANGDANI